MLKPGWLNRYQPPIALTLMPDIIVIFGYVWASLMLFSAILNAIIAVSFSVAIWATFMPLYGIVSKLALIIIHHVTMRTIGIRRSRLRNREPAPPVLMSSAN